MKYSLARIDLNMTLNQGPRRELQTSSIQNVLSFEQMRKNAKEATKKRKIAVEAYWFEVRRGNLDRVMKYRFGTVQ